MLPEISDEHLSALLESINYQRVLELGFALVRDGQDRLVASAAVARELRVLTLTFADGEVKTRID